MFVIKKNYLFQKSFPLKKFSFLKLHRKIYFYELKSNRAIIFPNGYGLLSKVISFPKLKKSIDILPPTNAIYGTFWVCSPEELIIHSIRTTKLNHQEEINCSTISQLLQANINQVIELFVENIGWVTGRIDSVIIDEQSTSLPKPGIVLLINERGTGAYPLNKVHSLRMPFHAPPELRSSTDNDTELEIDQQIQTKFTKSTKIDYFHISYENKSEEEKSGNILYLTQGLTWIPSYKLELNSSTKEGKFSFYVTIMNDSEDLNFQEIICVVNKPILNNKLDIFDPLVNKKTVQEFLSLMKTENENIISQSFTIGDEKLTTLQLNENKINNFYMYQFNQITLKKNDRISLCVFNMEISSYQNIYYCRVTSMDNNNIANSPEVWKTIQLKNTTEFFWVSGPILVTLDSHFLLQSKINQTCIGDFSLLNIKKEENIQISCNQLSQELTEVIEIKNKKTKPITLILEREFYEKSSSINEKQIINQKNKKYWEINLQPGEIKQIIHHFNQIIYNNDK